MYRIVLRAIVSCCELSYRAASYRIVLRARDACVDVVVLRCPVERCRPPQAHKTCSWRWSRVAPSSWKHSAPAMVTTSPPRPSAVCCSPPAVGVRHAFLELPSVRRARCRTGADRVSALADYEFTVVENSMAIQVCADDARRRYVMCLMCLMCLTCPRGPGRVVCCRTDRLGGPGLRGLTA
jgi:hypothetical protein